MDDSDDRFCPVCKGQMEFIQRYYVWRCPEHGLFLATAHEEMCPACLRIRDKYPADCLTLSGPYLQEQRTDIINLVRNEEVAEKAEHAVHRIMAIEEHADQVFITTTDIHLPRRIGEALRRAHRGELDFHYEEEGNLLRVSWQH